AADRIAAAALRRAEAVRTISPFTTARVRALGVEVAASFPTFVDLPRFRERPPAPLPEHPRALFVAVLEPYKNVDGLAAAWRLTAPRLPTATLRLVGNGSRAALVRALVDELPEQTTWTPELDSAGVAAALDEATVLVLPSRSEGMGRILIEAFCRGRGVVGTRAGGIPDLVEDGVNGLLVDPNDTLRLADALERVLSDRPLAERLGAAALERVRPGLLTADEYGAHVRALVQSAMSPRTGREFADVIASGTPAGFVDGASAP